MAPRRPVILLVDDDPDFRVLHARVLAAEGYAVVEAGGREEALARLAEGPVDLVVTDVMMSSRDAGFSLCRQMRRQARFEDLPVIVVTAIGSQLGYDFAPRTGEDLSDMGADAFFEKPVAPGALVAAVRRLLERGRRAPSPGEGGSGAREAREGSR
jgi:CheY-like chemotaxis protein